MSLSEIEVMECDEACRRLAALLPDGFIVKAQLWDYAREIGLVVIHPSRDGYFETVLTRVVRDVSTVFERLAREALAVIPE